ncbi:hypothetical protein L1887_51467 [Cichorium endivia]|nr:hypothetical protein L1887_51467 [Cichorium endivia]
MAAHVPDQPSSFAEKVWPGKAVADLPGAAVSMVASAASQTSEVSRLPPSHHHPRAPPSPHTNPASKPTSITAHLTTRRPNLASRSEPSASHSLSNSRRRSVPVRTALGQRHPSSSTRPLPPGTAGQARLAEP